MIKLNNFHGYFPGGYRRPELYEVTDEEYHCENWKIKAKYVDYFLEQYGIDPNEIKKLRELWFSGINKVSAMGKDKRPIEEVKEIGEEAEKHRDKLQEMIYPVYISMLELGFSEMDLIG